MNIDTRIKFRHLVCFLEVARQGTLARASLKLAISQPALSKTLKELESLLCAALFIRSKSGAASVANGAWMRRGVAGAEPCLLLRHAAITLRSDCGAFFTFGNLALSETVLPLASVLTVGGLTTQQLENRRTVCLTFMVANTTTHDHPGLHPVRTWRFGLGQRSRVGFGLASAPSDHLADR